MNAELYSCFIRKYNQNTVNIYNITKLLDSFFEIPKKKKNNNKSSVKQYFKMNVTWPKITQYIIICAAWNSYEKFRWIHKTNIVQIFFFKRERNVFINSNKFNNNVNVQRMKFNSNLLQTTLKMYKIVYKIAQMFNI